MIKIYMSDVTTRLLLKLIDDEISEEHNKDRLSKLEVAKARIKQGIQEDKLERDALDAARRGFGVR